MRNYRGAVRTRAIPRPGRAGVEGAGEWGSRGLGRSARGRRRGLAGLRGDVPNQTTATQPHWCGGRGRDWRARLRCPWAVAGPGRASRRRAERSSRRGRLAGGPPPTGTPSSPAHTQPGTRSPAHAAHTARGPKRRSASGPCVNRVSSQVELDVAAGDGLDQLARVVLNRVVK